MTIPKIVKHERIDRHTFKLTIEAENAAAAGLYIGNFYGAAYNSRYQYTLFDNPNRHVFRVTIAGVREPMKRPRIAALATVLAGLMFEGVR